MHYRFLHRKDSMLIAAIDILDKVGIQGLTTKEIAKAEGVSEAAVYKHYTGKQEIIAAILEKFASFDDQICNTILQKRMTERQGILFYANAYAENYQWYPQIATVLFSFDVYRYTPELKAIMENTMRKRKDFLISFIGQSRQNENLACNIEVDVLANLILGCIANSVYFWTLQGKDQDLKSMIMKGIEALLKAQ